MFDLIKSAKVKTFILLCIEAFIVATFIIGKTLFIDIFPFLEKEEAIYVLIGVLFIIPLILLYSTIRSVEKGTKRNHITISNILGADISEAYTYGEIGLVIYNEQREIIWTSDLFIDRGINLLGQTVTTRFPMLERLFTTSEDGKQEKEQQVTINQRIYKVICLNELGLLIFKDVSEVESLYQIQREESPVIVAILFDNMMDVVNISKDDESVQIEALMRKTIVDWGKEFGVVIKRIKDDTYIGVLNEVSYNKISSGQFKLLNDITKISSGRDITFTISMGFGRGITNYSKLSELSASAIDVAQSRGGNQVVVNNFGGHMEFYGGVGMEVKMKKSAVKNRVLAQSFYAHVQTYKNILITFHEDADFDAVGAALGVVAIAKTAGKQVHIVYDEKQIEVKTRRMLKEQFSRSELEMISISPVRALDNLTDETLLVVLDVNRASICTAPRLVERAQNVALIDHHRRAEDAIDSPMLNHIDTTASSTSEIISEIIINSPVSVKVSTKVATFLLAGILLDTNGFKTKTSSLTFKAAMNLKEFGADNAVADSYLKDEYEEFALKTQIMSDLESPHFGIVIAKAPENQIIAKSILARVAQEVIGVKGIKAVFVIGYIKEKTVGISARSDGTVNVQLIMEKMGGGGHHSASATQIPNVKIDAASADLKKTLELYINDIL